MERSRWNRTPTTELEVQCSTIELAPLKTLAKPN